MITWLEKPTTVCAWCGATMIEGDWVGPVGRPPMDAFLSHGICPDCASAYADADLPLTASVESAVAHP